MVDFIEHNYMNKITISEIADFIGLDRSYLCSIFKKNIHCSIQEYLIQLRINKSCTLLKQSDLSIGNIAKAVGYQDPFLFSRTFKKIKKSSTKRVSL
nr:AraC family transcriptional regulator [Bacillus sp. JCM 19034]